MHPSSTMRGPQAPAREIRPRLGWVTPFGGEPIPVRYVEAEHQGWFIPVTGAESTPVAIGEGDLVEVDTIRPGQRIVSGL